MGARPGVAVTVVVPARDAAATIGGTLAALAAQDVDRPYEVIVVDSGSCDPTPGLVEASAAVLLRNPGGEPAGSRNVGAARGAGAALAFTDADCEPEPGWLSAGLRALQGADLVQGRVVPARAPGPFERTVTVGRDHGLYETANLFVTRELFERVGGFEPVLAYEHTERRPFGEDAWFGWRARRSGARAVFAADATVRHAVFPRTAREYIAERVRTRHFPPLVARIPELRSEFLYRGLFLSPDSARFDLAVAGLLTRRRLPAALCALPYLVTVARSRAPARVAADAVTFVSLVRGSVASRTPVL